MLLNNKLRLFLRINLLNNTVDDIKELLSEFNKEEYYFFKLYFRPIYNTKKFNCNKNLNVSTLDEFYDVAAESGAQIHLNKTPFFYCEADGCENKFTILPDLSVWKCINDMDCKDSKIGTINKNGKLILDLNKLAKWEMCDPFKDKKCQNCVKLPLCWGGCPLIYLTQKKRSCYYEKNFDILPLLSEQGSSH